MIRDTLSPMMSPFGSREISFLKESMTSKNPIWKPFAQEILSEEKRGLLSSPFGRAKSKVEKHVDDRVFGV